MSSFARIHHFAPKFIANRCIISIIYINLSVSRLPDTAVLDSSPENRRKLTIEFLREHPQETVASVCRLYQVDPEAIYKHRKRTRKHTRGG
jgi:hypothetical protein